MIEPSPAIRSGAPIAVEAAEVVFGTEPGVRRGTPSLAWAGSVLLATFGVRPATGGGPSHVMLARSMDAGRTWGPARPIVTEPDRSTFPAGLSTLTDGRLRLSVIALEVDLALGGNEPFNCLETIEYGSIDGGQTWAASPEPLRLLPGWTEMYGPSNPHPLPDGDLLWSLAGTTGRDVGWTVATVRTGPDGNDYDGVRAFPTSPDEFADPDIGRLPDGRLLAVFRGMYTRLAYQATSADDGDTWSTPAPTGFSGANLHLVRLNDGSVLAFHRDEDPERPGVSVQRTTDGERWEWLGQVYATPDLSSHRPTMFCGYPAVIRIDAGHLLCLIQSYCEPDGSRYLHSLRIRDLTSEAPCASS